MSHGLNRVMLLGDIAAEPEIYVTRSGQVVQLLLVAERARADAALARVPSQDLWIKLRQELGDQEVRRLIVKKLRDFADLVECNEVSRGRVYGVRVDRLGEFPCTGDSPIEDVAVSLSRPWGG